MSNSAKLNSILKTLIIAWFCFRTILKASTISSLILGRFRCLESRVASEMAPRKNKWISSWQPFSIVTFLAKVLTNIVGAIAESARSHENRQRLEPILESESWEPTKIRKWKLIIEMLVKLFQSRFWKWKLIVGMPVKLFQSIFRKWKLIIKNKMVKLLQGVDQGTGGTWTCDQVDCKHKSRWILASKLIVGGNGWWLMAG